MMSGVRMPTQTRDPRAAPDRPLETDNDPDVVIDARRAIAYQQRGAHDPSHTVHEGIIWRVSRTPEGVATLAIRVERDRVRGAAWGPGADWALQQLPRLCGAADDPDGFEADRHPLIADVHRRHPALRIGRTDLVFDALASAIFEQKVTGLQAFGAWRMILTWCGERAPGPRRGPCSRRPRIGADTQLDLASRRARAAAGEDGRVRGGPERLDRAAAASATDGDARDRVFTSLPGVGVWTSAEARIRAFGDADAVSVGDYHLCHQVGYALTGRRVDDDGMCALLEPWRGHRQRVIRLIGLCGAVEPRRGPRLAPEDHRGR